MKPTFTIVFFGISSTDSTQHHHTKTSNLTASDQIRGKMDDHYAEGCVGAMIECASHLSE